MVTGLSDHVSTAGTKRTAGYSASILLKNCYTRPKGIWNDVIVNTCVPENMDIPDY
jgi:hypothetical protein